MSAENLFQIEITGDGSPSLRLRRSDGKGYGEAMHNLKGAFSETLYLYWPVLQKAFNWPLPTLRLLSVGLGLGYIELLAAGFALQKASPPDWQMVSYESEEFLRKEFLAWLKNKVPHQQPWIRLHEIYEHILQLVSEHTMGSAKAIKDQLLTMHENEHWQLEGALCPNMNSPLKFHGIFYDAFSAHTSPDLWQEANLFHILQQYAADPCVLATYASTGALKRNLKKLHFEIKTIPGFGGKRQSTLAERALETTLRAYPN